MVRDKSKLPISVQKNKKVKLMICDIRDSNRYTKEISQINYLIHTATAWGDPRRAYEVNVKAFEELLEMLDIKKLEKIHLHLQKKKRRHFHFVSNSQCRLFPFLLYL